MVERKPNIRENPKLTTDKSQLLKQANKALVCFQTMRGWLPPSSTLKVVRALVLQAHQRPVKMTTKIKIK
jgi:hypothetical protein